MEHPSNVYSHMAPMAKYNTSGARAAQRAILYIIALIGKQELDLEIYTTCIQ
jgi:hypothetical protein